MNVTLSTDLQKQLAQELASGGYKRVNDLVEQAIRRFLDERQNAQRRLKALRKGAAAVDQLDLIEQVLSPDSD